MKANINWNDIPETMGIYMLKGQDGQVIYISKARNLRERMKEYSQGTNNEAQNLLLDNVFSYEIIETINEKKTYQLEKKLIEEHNPKFNIKIKSATSYPYVEFYCKQDKPQLKLAKRRVKKSSVYFGPVKTNQFGHQVVFLLNKLISAEKGENVSCDDFKMICDDFFSGEDKLISNLIKKHGEEKDYEIIKQWKENNVKMFNDKLRRDIFNYYYQDGILSICLTFVRFGNVGLTANFFQKSFEVDPAKAVENFISRYYEDHIFPDEIITPFEYIPWAAPKSSLVMPYDEKTTELSNNAKEIAKSKFDKRIMPFKKKFEDYSKLKKESE